MSVQSQALTTALDSQGFWLWVHAIDRRLKKLEDLEALITVQGPHYGQIVVQVDDRWYGLECHGPWDVDGDDPESGVSPAQHDRISAAEGQGVEVLTG